jgi:hypothetical protein
VLFLTGSGLFLTMMVEVVVLRGDITRMNTVFKFYLQAWSMLSLAAAASLAWLLPAVHAIIGIGLAQRLADLPDRRWYLVLPCSRCSAERTRSATGCREAPQYAGCDALSWLILRIMISITTRSE